VRLHVSTHKQPPHASNAASPGLGATPRGTGGGGRRSGARPANSPLAVARREEVRRGAQWPATVRRAKGALAHHWRA